MASMKIVDRAPEWKRQKCVKMIIHNDLEWFEWQENGQLGASGRSGVRVSTCSHRPSVSKRSFSTHSDLLGANSQRLWPKTGPVPKGDPRAEIEGLMTGRQETREARSEKREARSEEHRSHSRARSTIPANLDMTEAMRELIVARGCTDPDAAFHTFVDHHTAKQTRYVDWQGAVWRTWVSNHGKYGCPCDAPQRSRGRDSVVEKARTIARKWAAEEKK